MVTVEELEDFFLNGDKIYMPLLSIHCVIFGYENRQLKVLLSKWIKMDWGLPGGFIKWDEAFTDAAKRILHERTSLDHVFLKQFYTFGDSQFRINFDGVIAEEWTDIPADSWLAKRTSCIGYYALIDCAKAKIELDWYAEDFKWVDVNEISDNLIFDHKEILDLALVTLRNQIFQEPIGFELLPEKFTLPEIQTLYETILDKKLHRRNFPNKLLSLGIIEKLDEKRNIGQHRSPFLYKFHDQNYKDALEDRLVLSL